MRQGADEASPEASVAYLALGSNLGDRRANLEQALARLAEVPGVSIARVSRRYRTAPWGVTEQPEFLNLAVEIRANLSPQDLLAATKQIERRLGRTSTERWGPRVIDIDILMYDAIAMESDDLVLPHPGMVERAFVLVPLADIAPDLILPDGQRVADAAQALRREQYVDADV